MMKYLFSHKAFTLGVLSFMAIVLGGLFYAAPVKAAGPCSGSSFAEGRNEFCGYFNNNYDQWGGDVLPPPPGHAWALWNSTNASTFIAQIKWYLNGGMGEEGRTGAEFLIDTMIGLGAGSSRNVGTTNCNAYSNNAYCIWQNSINGYANGTLGSVNWYDTITVRGNECNGSNSANINTYWQSSEDDDAYFRDNDCTRDGVYSETTEFIVFTNKNGSQYIVRKKCGNPYKNISALTRNTPPVGTITATSCTTVSVKLWDPNNPTSRINYYLAVNGSAVQGPFPFGGKNAAATSRTVSGYPGFNYWKNNNVVLYGDDVNTGQRYNLGNVNLGVCGKISCTGSMTTLPGNMVAGKKTSFTVWVKVTGAPAGPLGGKFTSVQMKDPQGHTSTIATNVGYTGATTLTDNDPSLSYTPETSGNYTLIWTFGGGESNPPSVTCAPPANVSTSQAAFEPYFTVIGGDIAAGPGFGAGCTEQPASIDGETLGSGGSYFGASSREGALATNGISQFASDTTNDISNNLGGSSTGITGAIQPNRLAFSNVSPPAGAYGGKFMNGASTEWCVQSFTSGEATATTAYSMSDISVGTHNYQQPGTYSYVMSGPQDIGNITLSPGVRVTIYVKGDIYINGDILYGNYGGNSLGEPSANMAANIPQFNLISDGGNIYIYSAAPGVSPAAVQELHGLYVAQPSSAGSGGTMYTCATGIGSPTNSYNTCNEPLTFYGAVSAKSLELDRTRGNVAKTTSPTDPNYPASESDYPAEQFVFTPENWLGSVSVSSQTCKTNPSSCLYQSYTSLPPVL